VTLFVRAKYKDSEFGMMRWYGRKGGLEIFQTPTGRLYHVVDPGAQKDAQKVAFAAWKKDGFR
jgi:hypothetical protein